MDRLHELQADAITRARLAAWIARNWWVPIGTLSQIVASQARGIVEKPSESLPFWLTTEERESIAADITARKPIWDTPAYRKFLQFIFPNTSVTFPYLPGYFDALLVVSHLSKLFGRVVRLPDEREAKTFLLHNEHLTGYYNPDSKTVMGTGNYGCVWIANDNAKNLPMVVTLYRNNGQLDTKEARAEEWSSVIPIFA